MKRDDALAILRAHEAELKRLLARRRASLCSARRRAMRRRSHRTSIRYFDRERGKLGLYQLMEVKELAADIRGRKTDIMTRGSLHPRLEKPIEDSAVRMF